MKAQLILAVSQKGEEFQREGAPYREYVDQALRGIQALPGGLLVLPQGSLITVEEICDEFGRVIEVPHSLSTVMYMLDKGLVGVGARLNLMED